MLSLLKDIWLITQKELLYASRDPDVLIYTVLVPLVIYPVLFIGTSDLGFWLAGQFERQTSKIAVQPVPDKRYELVTGAIKTIERSELLKSPDAMAELRAGKLDAYVSFEGPASVFINVAQSSLINNTATKILATTLLEQYKQEDLYTKQSGLSKQQLRVFEVEDIDIAPSAATGEFRTIEQLRGLPLPLMILFAFVWIHIVIGMAPPATIMFAEQREKKTMETTMLEPVGRLTLVCGKFLTTWLVGMMSGLMYTISIILTVGTIAGVMAIKASTNAGVKFHGTANFWDLLHFGNVALESWLLFAAMIVINTALCAMALLAAGSRAITFKQAQALLTLPLVLFISVPLFAFIPGIELNLPTALVPALNLFLVVKRGEPNVALSIIAFVWSLLLIAFSLLLTRHLISTEQGSA